MGADPAVTRFKALSRKVKAALDKKKPVPLDALAELAGRGDKPAQTLMAKRSKEDAVLDALFAAVDATEYRCSYIDVLATSKHPNLRDRILAAIPEASPPVFSELAGALVKLTPGKAKRVEECALLLAHATSGIPYVIDFVNAHGTPEQKSQIAALFDRDLRQLGYIQVLEAVDPDPAELFDYYREYFTRPDRQSSFDDDRIYAIRSCAEDAKTLDKRWLGFLLEVVRDGGGAGQRNALWLLEMIAKKQGKARFPHATLAENMRGLVTVEGYQLWCHVFDIMALAPIEPYVALAVDHLAADLDARQTIDALQRMPKQLVGAALKTRGIPTLADADNRAALQRLVGSLGPHAPKTAAPPKPELLWQLIDDADPEGVQNLLAAGVSPETPPPGNYDLPTPLFHAIGALYWNASERSLGVVEQLLAAGAKRDVKLGTEWDLRDVHFKPGETVATVTRKLLKHLTPPYDNTFERTDPTFMEGELYLTPSERAELAASIKKAAKLMASA